MKKLYNINSIGKTSLLFALSSLLLLTACTQEEDFAPQNGKDTPISIASVSVGDVVATRVLDDNGGGKLTGNQYFEVNMLTIVQSKKGGKYASAEGGELWKIGTGNWEFVSGETVYFEDNPQNQTITAFSGGEGAAAPELTDGKITYTIDNVPDLLFAEKKPVANQSVELNMRHMMSRVTVFITGIGNTMSNTAEVANVTITNLPTQVTFDPLNEDENYLQYSKDETFDGERQLFWLSNAQSPDMKFRRIIIPRTSDMPIKFGVVVKMRDGSFLGTTFTPTREDKTNGGTIYGLDGGYNYTLSLQLGADAISIDKVTVEEWKNGGTIDASQATEPEATYSIDSSTMTVTVDEYTGSFNKALNEAIKHGCETMIVNGTLTARQQTVLANTLLGYEGTLVLAMAEDAVSNENLKNLVDGYSGCVIKTENDVTTYSVYIANGLYAWNTAVQTDLSANCTLMADITLPNKDLTSGNEITVEGGVPDGSNWTPRSYAGTFDGNGKTINGLRINSEKDAGFVADMEGGTIKNLTLDDAIIYSTGFCGFVGAASSTSITGCTVKGSIRGKSGTGGIAGYIGTTTIISNCRNEASVISESRPGGIVGYMVGGEITGCTNVGSVTGLDSDTRAAYIGGIVGYVNGNIFIGGSNISDCTNSGEVKGGTLTAADATVAVGGIVGYFVGNNYSVTISDQTYIRYSVMHQNTNTGSVTGGSATNAYTGGLVGLEESSVSDRPTTYGSLVYDCNRNSGEVTDKDGNFVTYLVGWSARGKEDPDTDEPEYVSLTFDDLTPCDGKCKE